LVCWSQHRKRHEQRQRPPRQAPEATTALVALLPRVRPVASVIRLGGRPLRSVGRLWPERRGLVPGATRCQHRDDLRAVAGTGGHTHLDRLDLRGPHDLRHNFATWLEDDGIPARVIDEVMGHAPSRPSAFALDAARPMAPSTGTPRRRWRPGVITRVLEVPASEFVPDELLPAVEIEHPTVRAVRLLLSAHEATGALLADEPADGGPAEGSDELPMRIWELVHGSRYDELATLLPVELPALERAARRRTGAA
jgi:hypothetical protein